MGFFTDLSRSLFGGDSHSESTQKQQQTQTQSQQQTQVQSQAQTQAQSQTQAQTSATQQAQTGTATQQQAGKTTTSTLDPQVMAALTALIPHLTSSLDNGQASQDAGTARALGSKLEANADTDTAGLIKNAQDAARQQFAQSQGATIAGVQQQIGSKANGFSAAIESQGNAALAGQLAEISASITQNARTQSDQEIAAAVDAAMKASSIENAGFAAPLQNLLAVVQTLSGANQTTTTEQGGTSTNATTGTANTQASSQTDILSILDSLSQAASQANATSTATGVATSAGNAAANNGWLNNIVGLFK